MAEQPSHRLALVTGGAQRIGAAIVAHLHGLDFDILLHYRSSRSAAEQLAATLNSHRADSCSLLQADLQDLEQLQRLASRVLESAGGVDLLVNNASDFAPTALADCSADTFDRLLGSNLRGPYFLIQGLLPGLRARRGNIVNILDVHAEQPLRDYNVYCAAKAGMAALTRSLALELAPDIRVNGVAPGAILWPAGAAEYDASEKRDTLAATPLGRLGEPLDIARAVAFLADEAPFITGQVLTVDGGRSLA